MPSMRLSNFGYGCSDPKNEIFKQLNITRDQCNNLCLQNSDCASINFEYSPLGNSCYGLHEVPSLTCKTNSTIDYSEVYTKVSQLMVVLL